MQQHSELEANNQRAVKRAAVAGDSERRVEIIEQLITDEASWRTGYAPCVAADRGKIMLELVTNVDPSPTRSDWRGVKRGARRQVLGSSQGPPQRARVLIPGYFALMEFFRGGPSRWSSRIFRRSADVVGGLPNATAWYNGTHPGTQRMLQLAPLQFLRLSSVIRATPTEVARCRFIRTSEAAALLSGGHRVH